MGVVILIPTFPPVVKIDPRVLELPVADRFVVRILVVTLADPITSKVDVGLDVPIPILPLLSINNLN